MNNTLIKLEKQLAIIAGGEKKSYLERKEALDKISNSVILNDLAINAKDEWIQLESAIKCGNKKILLQLANEALDEGVKLEAALELKNEFKLAEIALSGNLVFHGSIAIGHIFNPKLLKKIAIHSKYNRLKAEAALKLGDIELIIKLAEKIKDEWIRYQLAASINHINLLKDLSLHSSDEKIRTLSNEWLEDLNYNNRSYKGLHYRFFN